MIYLIMYSMTDATNAVMSTRLKRTQTVVTTALFLTACSCLVVMSIRIFHTISFFEPLQALTSGYEEESLFSIWKWVYHKPIFEDPHRIPFAASYFNWAFYTLYGTMTAGILSSFHLADAWIPTICRIGTFLFTIGLVPLSWAVINEANLWPVSWRNVDKACFCLILAGNPLLGFWAVTTRPDAAALFFELAGLWAFLRYLRDWNSILLFLAVSCFYLAWSFRQTNVTLITGCCVFLLFKRRFVIVLCATLVSFLLYAVSMIIFGKLYVFSLLFSQRHMPLIPAQAVTNLVKASAKFPFLPMGVCLVLWWRRLATQDSLRLLLLCFIISFAAAAITSAKVGASDNYYFVSAMMAALLLLGVVANKQALFGVRGFAVPLLLTACVGVTIASASVLTGRAGVLNIQARNRDIQTLSKSLSKVSGPVLVYVKGPGNLPWIQPNPPNFVLSCAYDLDRAAGVPFQSDGVGGLVKANYFRYIVIGGTDRLTQIDGATLANYEPEFSDGPYSYWRRHSKN